MLDQMETVRSPDGTAIAYRRVGEGPPLVLVHGSADDHTCWLGLISSLGEHANVYALDRRGHGSSGQSNPSRYTLQHELDDIAALVTTLGEPAYLLGHSYGALCALEAARYITDLRGLILNEPPFRADPAQPISPPGALERLVALLEDDDLEGATLTFAREIARLPEHEIAAVRTTPAWQSTIDLAPTLPYELETVETFRFNPGRYSGLTTPTLLLLGSESPAFLKAATESVAASLPNVKVAVLEGQGHLAMHTAPEQFLREVIEFLNET